MRAAGRVALLREEMLHPGRGLRGEHAGSGRVLRKERMRLDGGTGAETTHRGEFEERRKDTAESLDQEKQ